jgi:hypothetical protein
VLAIFVAFVVGVIVGKMQLFVVSGKAIGTIALLLRRGVRCLDHIQPTGS